MDGEIAISHDMKYVLYQIKRTKDSFEVEPLNFPGAGNTRYPHNADDSEGGYFILGIPKELAENKEILEQRIQKACEILSGQK